MSTSISPFLIDILCGVSIHVISNHIVTSDCLFQIASKCAARGRYRVAIELMERSLSIRSLILGEENLCTVKTKYSLVVLYRISDSKIKEAITLLEQVLIACEKHMPVDNDMVGEVCITAALTYLVRLCN
jgi:hypothetical protein